MSVPKPQASALSKNTKRETGFITRGHRPENIEHKVHVSGFPPYTTVEDLQYVFSPYGPVNVKLAKRHAVITFPDSEGAADAIAHSKKVCVYGSVLSIRRHRQPPSANPRNQFVRSKEKGMIIKPQQLDLSGDFHHQLYQLLESVRLTKQEVVNICSLYTDLETALRRLWPECSTVPFGSITTGLGIKSSDADCFVLLPEHLRREDGNLVSQAKQALWQYPDLFTEVYAIPNAHTPIVKFFHIPTETTCDVSFKNPLGSRNSRLVAFVLHADPRFLPLAVAIKYWAKVHELSGTGKMTNYALTMLLVFYLQHRMPLPAVEWLQRDVEEDLVDGWNTAFQARPDLLQPRDLQSGIAELIGGFFEFYANFDFGLLAVCPFLGHALAKAAFAEPDTLPDVLERYKRNVRNKLASAIRFTTPICIQDPFQLCHNVGSCITSKLAAELVQHFKFAAETYRVSKTDEYTNFLKTILFNKPPKLDNFRSKVNIIVRFRDFERVTCDEWKKIVSRVIRILFEDICHTALVSLSIDETVKLEGKKEVETYSLTLTKPVWKRKGFPGLFKDMKGSFVEKQIKITNEIMCTFKEAFTLKMKLSIRFIRSTKSAVVKIEYEEGEHEHFHEFGKMCVIMLGGWFSNVVKPLLPAKNESTHNEPAKKVSKHGEQAKSEQQQSEHSINRDSSGSTLNALSENLQSACTTSDDSDVHTSLCL